MKKYKLDKETLVLILLLMMFIGGVFGYIYEVIFYKIDTGKFINRGTTIGPWIPIYAFGSLLIYLTTYNATRFKNYAKSTNLLARDFKDYISYIPTYSKNTTKTSNNNYFHVIIEKNKGSVHNYGIMEVYRK